MQEFTMLVLSGELVPRTWVLLQECYCWGGSVVRGDPRGSSHHGTHIILKGSNFSQSGNPALLLKPLESDFLLTLGLHRSPVHCFNPLAF